MGCLRQYLLLVLVSASLLLEGAINTAHAAQDDAGECATADLRTARVMARVDFTHDGEDYTRADSRFTVKVPTTWKRAYDLLLNGDTERYRKAMRCLLREPDAPFVLRDSEHRAHPPKVKAEARWVTIEQRASTVVSSKGAWDFGPWHLTVGTRLWTLELQVPPALKGARWERIEAGLDGRAAQLILPPPTEGTDTELVWLQKKAGEAPPHVQMTLQPPAAKALTARWVGLPARFATEIGIASFDAGIYVLLWAAIRRLRQVPVTSPSTPGPSVAPTPGPAESAALRGLWLLVLLLPCMMLVHGSDDLLLDLLDERDATPWLTNHRVAVHLIVSTFMGLAWCVFGRPRRLAFAAAALAAAGVTTVVAFPGVFGLPASMVLDSNTDPDGVQRFLACGGMYWFGAACACAIFIILVGATASGLRIWRSLSRSPSAFLSPGHFPLSVLGVLVLLASALSAAAAWAAQVGWDRSSWLSARTVYSEYGNWHLSTVFNDFSSFPSEITAWAYNTVWWWFLGLAVLSVLRARVSAACSPPVLPSRPDQAVLLLFYLVVVVPFLGWYAEVQLPLLGMAAGWLALSGLLALGRRHAVLQRDLLPGVPLYLAVHESDRQHLMEAARRHRDLHTQLRNLDQGQQDGERRRLERTLDRLQRWRPPHAVAPHRRVPLPDGMDPVDVALAWGPRASWWDNGCRAAQFASALAVPMTAMTTWADNIRGPLWGDTFAMKFGFANLVTSAAASVIIWTGAGFVLGAFWRQLPGRRGPVKALGLSMAYAAPWLLDSIGVAALRQSYGTRALDMALTLLILTLTGLAMDIDTFRREQHYWPTRASLLLSLYQLRTASVQIAFFVAQLVALVTIWQQLRGADPMIIVERPQTSGERASIPQDSP
ncbi:predicted protein [Streptomyces viridochromogenes DSM 40736]|uniref:Predicted protein n=1 Tax=Streptomyces viridochromogenes (strain DSM 40736 / JCM 4977 / BCRC 1201 / Tue 494) TaxID=591159 RepID=D9X336_STRVT|nr:DUF6185 family protein [Streptomyces viridochromogenes]EFL29552.1 predicted protein [Streptomyces viridochromogenes DSM 40736]